VVVDGEAVGAVADEATLAGLGTVPAGYRHHERRVVAGAPLALPGALLTWYAVHRPKATVPCAAETTARAHLRAEAAAGWLELGHGLGFVVFHVSDTTVYLLVGTWYQTQELWQSLFVREPAGEAGYRRVHPGFDWSRVRVWGPAPVWHERQAWVRYLGSKRDATAKRAHLNDRMEGHT
jgi:hypothetical protein